jgi:rhomboid protease GluP
LQQLGAAGTLTIRGLHGWWSLLAANYLHAGILHILFNMAALRQLAPVVIREYGPSRMMIIYTIGGAFGFLLSFLVGVRLTIGASAAVCGLVGAILYYGKSRGGAYGTALYKQVGGWVLFLFVFGLLVPGINNWGHGGGIAAGLLLGYLLGYRERKPERLWQKRLAGALALTTLLVLVWAVLSALMQRAS